MIYAIGFACALVEAVIIWLLSSHVHKRHEEFLQSRLEASEKMLVSLTDRIQAPTTPDLVKRQEAQAAIEDRKALPPQEREAIRQNLMVEEIIETGAWSHHPAFSSAVSVQKDPNSDSIMIEWPATAETMGLPDIQVVPRGEFIRPFMS